MANKKAPSDQGPQADAKYPADVILSIRLDGPMHERLRKLAFDQRSTKRDLIVKGLDLLLTAEKY